MSVLECRCHQTMEFNGAEAERYAREHLVRDETREGAMIDIYTCPDTGKRWILEWPEGPSGQAGPARLRAEAPT